MKTGIPKGALYPTFSITLCFALSGCTLFFGTVKPVEIRSADYKILDLSKTNRHWIRLGPETATPSRKDSKGGSRNGDSSSNEPSDSDAGISDLAYQEKKSGSVISVNSACKNYRGASANEDLPALTQELLLGLLDKEILKEQTITVAALPAWETTAKGTMNHQDVILKTVVLERANCVYGLILVTKPDSFKKDEPIFSQFVSSLQFK